jgi:hypothetical protein
MTIATAVRSEVATRRYSHRELEEVLAPEMFTFSAPGDCVAGVLLSIDKVTVKGKPVTQYLLRLEDSEKRVQLLATYDLDRKLQPQHKGLFVEITYIGENKMSIDHPITPKRIENMRRLLIAQSSAAR